MFANRIEDIDKPEGTDGEGRSWQTKISLIFATLK